MSGFGLSGSKHALLLLLLYAGHDLALSEFREILFVHVVFWTGNFLFGTIHP
jgi:hypothetical protein